MIQTNKLDKLSSASKQGKIGVCIEASRDTLDQVPYLTHQDFAKQLMEFTDLCDYVVISLSSGGTGGPMSNGLQQYYRNPAALEKLLHIVTHARAAELGRLAAFEFEKKTNDDQDYLVTVKRNYTRSSLVSNLKPISLFVKIDPQAAGF